MHLLRWSVVLALLAVLVAGQQNEAEQTRIKLRPRLRSRDSTSAPARPSRPTRPPRPTRKPVNFNRKPTTTTTTTTTTSRPTRRPTTTAPETTSEGTLLVRPIPEKCAARPKHWKFGNHWYFFSPDEPIFRFFDEKQDREVAKVYDWLDSRNLCRKYCMDTVGLETEQEWKMIKNNISEREVGYIWTSGRLCDFEGCDAREDLKPVSVLGWFWSATQVKLAPTNSTPPGWSEQPWSPTGHMFRGEKKGGPQPDNAEFRINKTPESCLGVLNNIYEDGVTWHDIACYHEKPVLCEDSDSLLNFARAVNERDNLGLKIV